MHAGILIFTQAEELDFVGPWEILAMWHKVGNGPNLHLVAQSASPILCAKGMSVLPTTDFDHCPQLDYLLVPGGQGARLEVSNRVLIEFVARQAHGCKAVLSVCTGAFILHAAGLLSGKRVTTHWSALERLRALGDVTVVEERFVQDGSIWSSAGISAGIDLALAFIAHEAGEDVAGEVQFMSEYYPSTVRYGSNQHDPKAPRYLRRV
jgi:transcriptional regulator GlxA family with amidase domain